ncbi:hypothetical protein HRG84_16295 [Flavisolibacter sp. BT320]|nr:hypothetical protein [Flavisolibacter longurius]
MLNRSIELEGQWVGHFAYGPDYGEEMNGEKVQFRVFIDRSKNGGFVGRSVDLEGIGANFEVAEVKGFLEEGLISFTKQYPHFYALDEAGNTVEDKNKPHPLVAYTGTYNQSTKTFTGDWEMRVAIAPVGTYWLEDVCTGTWEMRKDVER